MRAIASKVVGGRRSNSENPLIVIETEELVMGMHMPIE